MKGMAEILSYRLLSQDILKKNLGKIPTSKMVYFLLIFENEIFSSKKEI